MLNLLKNTHEFDRYGMLEKPVIHCYKLLAYPLNKLSQTIFRQISSNYDYRTPLSLSLRYII